MNDDVVEYADWNQRVFEAARRKREAEFEKLLAEQRQEESQPECQPSLFTSSADSVASPKTSSRGRG